MHFLFAAVVQKHLNFIIREDLKIFNLYDRIQGCDNK